MVSDSKPKLKSWDKLWSQLLLWVLILVWISQYWGQICCVVDNKIFTKKSNKKINHINFWYTRSNNSQNSFVLLQFKMYFSFSMKNAYYCLTIMSVLTITLWVLSGRYHNYSPTDMDHSVYKQQPWSEFPQGKSEFLLWSLIFWNGKKWLLLGEYKTHKFWLLKHGILKMAS